MATQIYRVSFINQGKVYEIYAEQVQQGELYGFVEIGGFIFGETSTVVIDPAEEKLRGEFSGVDRTLIPMHAVIRIDAVEKRGSSKIHDLDGGNVTPFPSTIYTPGSGGGKP
jgi:hypothetical protein